MPVLSVTNISKSFGDKKVFEGVSFEVMPGERVAVVGPNGVGKTTVLKIVCGLEEPDEGNAEVAEGVEVGYVSQNPSFDPGATLRSELAGLPVEYPVDAGMKRFGFKKAELDQPMATMSGGQKTRLALLKVWAQQPGLLVLDEPTNHLDTSGQDWLEAFLRDCRTSVLLVSHDRYFLDKVATRVIELACDGARSFDGNYTAYRLCKERERQAQLEQWQEQEKEAKRLRKAINQQLRWFAVSHRDAGKTSDIRKGIKEFERARAARIAKRAKCTIKRLEKMISTGVEKPKDAPTVELSLEDAGKTGKRMIVAQELSKEYAKPLFAKASFAVMRGDKVGLVGPNASGKTTLVKLILGLEEASAGELWVSDGVKAGYMDQEFGNLPTAMSAFEAVLAATGRTDREAQTKVRNLLGSLLMRGEDVMKPVDVLSYGERMRLVIARLLLSDYNVLVLDEPTNHLDLPTRERLEEALMGWDGTLILVSHDRYLVDRVCNRILSIEDGTVRLYLGGYSYFLEERARLNAARAGGNSKEEKRRGRDELLVLRNRLAVLSAELGYMRKDDPDYSAKESEFLKIGKAVNEAAKMG